MDAATMTESDIDPSAIETAKRIRVDLQLIADMIKPESRVLDIGCGDGALLNHLARFKNVDGRGMELSQAGVNRSVAAGLSVIQGDADIDLADYPSNSFDYVILSQTLQATRDPRNVLRHLARIGRRAIVSFPNFGYWRVRWQLLITGRMPETKGLPAHWYDTPNIHLCTIRDFAIMCEEMNIRIERAISIAPGAQARELSLPLANLLGEQGVFLLSNH